MTNRAKFKLLAMAILTVASLYFGSAEGVSCAAVTVAAVAAQTGFIRRDTAVFNVTATADADTMATIPHGLGVIPDEVAIEPVDPAARISLWVETIASRDATNVVLTKATTAGSGAAGVQARVTIKKPHTIGR